jgi:hypothetical protein
MPHGGGILSFGVIPMSDALNQRAKTLALWYAANGLGGMKQGEVLLLLSEKQRYLCEISQRIAEGKASPVNLLLRRGLEGEINEIAGHFWQMGGGGREL